MNRFEFLGYRDVHRVHNGRKNHWITLDFKVLINSSKIKIGEPEKFTKLDWFTLKSLPPVDELHSQLPLFLQRYAEQLDK